MLPPSLVRSLPERSSAIAAPSDDRRSRKTVRPIQWLNPVQVRRRPNPHKGHVAIPSEADPVAPPAALRRLSRLSGYEFAFDSAALSSTTSSICLGGHPRPPLAPPRSQVKRADTARMQAQATSAGAS
eukprot:scaffold7340_cov266-Pinguiococcus_pyrenoidosus.AAC.49